MADDTGETLKRTALHDRHVALGAKIVPFAGWEMPIQYDGILAEHRAVRTAAGLFDLGHMGQVKVTGRDALAFLQYTTTNDIGRLSEGEAIYALLPNDAGGVVDDIIVYRQPAGHDGYMIVVNAANTAKDLEWWRELRERRDDLDVTVRDISDDLGMIAIQGPNAIEIVDSVAATAVDDIPNFAWKDVEIGGIVCRIARTGYTGEDGFEFYVSNDRTEELWDTLLEAGRSRGLAPIGLGARDTLRLEARMPLYGQELADDISPYEAGLGWAVSLDKGDFVGRGPMGEVKNSGAKRRTVGFTMTGRSGAPRPHCAVLVSGQTVGEVTSGTYSPTLERNIGLALIERARAGVGKPLDVVVRGRPIEAVQVKTPFYKRDG